MTPSNKQKRHLVYRMDVRKACHVLLSVGSPSCGSDVQRTISARVCGVTFHPVPVCLACRLLRYPEVCSFGQN
jgi:hypothetical protein